MKTFALASGSSGNCFYVESSNEKKFLIDLGLSFSRTKEILSEKNIDIEDIDAVFITHEHSDHCCGLETSLKKLDCVFFLSKGTQNALNISSGKIKNIKNHDIVNIGDIRVFAVSKPHDAKEALSFVFECEGKKIGCFTDLGYVTDEIKHIIKSLDIVYFETNYCEQYIKGKDYNINYLNRLISDKGHLGLTQACEILPLLCNGNQKIILSHISENTNTYENAYFMVKKAFEEVSKFPELIVSFQAEPSDWID